MKTQRRTRASLAGIVAVVARLCSANMYDVVLPTYTADLSSCPHGCLDWAHVPAFVDPATGPFPPAPPAGLFAVGLAACNSADPAQIWSGDTLTNSSAVASTLTSKATPGQCLGTRAHLPMLMDGGEPGHPEYGCRSTWTYNRTLRTIVIHQGEAGDGRCLDVNSSAPASVSSYMGGGCSATYPGATPGVHPITSGDRWEYLPVGAAASLSGLLQWHCGPKVANGSCPPNRCLAVSKLPSPPAPKMVNASTLFAAGQLPPGIGNSCAMPGSHAGSNQCDCLNQEMTYDAGFVLSSFAGPWCFCRSPASSPANSLYESPLMSYCEPPKGSVPEPRMLNTRGP